MPLIPHSMSGSYGHVTNEDGSFIDIDDFVGMIENLGDAYEAINHMWVMIDVLAGGDPARVADAKERAYARMRGEIR